MGRHSQRRNVMNNSLKQFIGAKKGMVAASALLLCPYCITSAEVKPVSGAAKKDQKVAESAGGFYCNTKALSSAERTRHEALTKKLLSVRRATVEIEKGYELQFSPADVTVAEVAEWVVAESKCCAFFDFHIDLENAGMLICLRLTGAEGVKQFIHSEFGIK